MTQKNETGQLAPLDVLKHIEVIYGPRVDALCMGVLKKLFSKTNIKAS